MKKHIALLVAAVMLCMLLPMAAFAELPYTEATYTGELANRKDIISHVRNNLFHDQILATEVLVQIDKLADGKPETDDWMTAMQSIATINLPYESTMHHKIQDLEGIQLLPNLQTLIMPGHAIEDVGALGDPRLANLKVIDLSDNLIQNTGAFNLISGLQKLNLSGNQVKDLGGVSKLTNLKELDVSNNNIQNIGALGGLTSLEKLALSGNQVQNLGGVSKLTNLKALDASNNNIQNLGSLVGLINLETLDLSYNQIEDLKEVSRLHKLTDLDVSHNKIQDLHWLQNLPLKSLDVSYNYIEDFSKLPGGVQVIGKNEQTVKPGVPEKPAKVPQTGDNSNVLLWTVLLLVAMAGMVGMVAYDKKQNHQAE